MSTGFPSFKTLQSNKVVGEGTDAACEHSELLLLLLLLLRWLSLLLLLWLLLLMMLLVLRLVRRRPALRSRAETSYTLPVGALVHSFSGDP